MKIPLVAGRDLPRDDTFGRPTVALINDTMARIYWKDRDPLGGRVMFGAPRADQEPQWITVVGVFKDIKQRSLTERPSPAMLIPILQFHASNAVLNVRTASEMTSMALRCNAPCGRSIHRCRSITSARCRITPGPRRSSRSSPATCWSCSASSRWRSPASAVTVCSRTWSPCAAERSAFLAVGATRADVFRLIAGSGARLIGAGVIAGLLLSVAVGVGLESLLIGIRPINPITYAGVIGALAIVAAAACLLPARRAASVDPVTTLREE